MSDYQRIVDEVRASLYSHSAETADQLRADAADFMVACQEINDRLRQCGVLLQRGLRSEAINLCEMEPNLLDSVATLDFPEREQWCQMAARYGVVSPAPLSLDVAADLNEAYALEQPLQTLLQRHRLLALARSPLKLRLQTLRKLAETDADNVIWREDQQVFERERQKQLQVEVSEAVKAGDLGRVATLDDELHQDDWLEMPPPSLLNWTAGVRLELLQKRAHQSLLELEPKLNDAFSEFDLDRGRKLREEWREQVARCGLPDDHPTALAAAPALEWLDSVDRDEALRAEHEAAESVLERALEADRPVPELERAHRGAERSGLEIEPRLEQRYQKRLADIAAAARRRKQLIFGSAAAVALAAVGITSWLIVGARHQAAVDGHVAALRQLLDEHQLAAGQEYVEKLQSLAPGVAAAPEMQEMERRLQGAVAADAERRAAFEKLFARAKQGGAEKPDRGALVEARKLAQSAGEQAELVEFDRAVAAADKQRQDNLDQAFLDQLTVFRGRIETLEKLEFPDLAAARDGADQFDSELRSWQESHATVSTGLLDQTQPLWTRSTALAKRIQSLQAEDAEEAPLSSLTGKPAQFREALLQFGRHHPDSKRGEQFLRVVDEMPMWEGMMAWDELIRGLRATPITKEDPKTAAAILATAKKVLADYSSFPDAELVRQRLPCLEAIAQRLDGDKPIDDKLRKLFHDKLVDGVWMVKKKDGRRYYCQAEPRWDQEKKIPFVTNFDFAEKTIPRLGGESPAFQGRAPQVALADELQKLLTPVADHWEGQFLKMVKAIRADTDTEPLLRLSLLQQVLEIGCRGSAPFKKGFGEHLAAIKGSNVNLFVNWLDPEDADAEKQRGAAKKLIEDLPGLDPAKTAVKDELDRVNPAFGAQYRWIGWLRHGRGGDWRCATHQALSDDGELYVVWKSAAGKLTIDRVGEIRQGVDRINASAGALVEGRPLWFKLAAP